jgi:hypothetical protein
VSRVLIVVDNLDLGGVQRLALDQAYFFSANGHECSIISFSAIRKGRAILDADGDYFEKNTIGIEVIPKREIARQSFFRKKIDTLKPEIVLCHSARALFYLRILRTIQLCGEYRLVGFIHQMPQMSSLLQNVKRALYFRFADFVFASSNQFALELFAWRRKNLFYRLLFRRDLSFDRVGVFLPRLDFLSSRKNRIVIDVRPLVYLGRITKWKGFERFCRIVEEDFWERSVKVFTSPAVHTEILDEQFFENHNREIVYSKCIASYDWNDVGIHLYPTFYTLDIRHPMSISLNVLECIYLGIPSLISKEGLESWPELADSILCLMTDWTKEDVKLKISILDIITKSDFQKEADRLREVISIEEHCKRMLNLV